MCKIKKMVLFVVAFFAIQSIATAQQMNVEMKNGETEVFSIADVNKITWTQSGQGLSKDSPVGAVGMLYGREAIVVDLGGSFGKVGIATQNDGASSGNIYGEYMKFDDAQDRYSNRTDGWFLPSCDQFKALAELAGWDDDKHTYTAWDNVNKGFRLNFDDQGTSLFLPAGGETLDGDLQYVGEQGSYWSCEKESDGIGYGLYFDNGHLSPKSQYCKRGDSGIEHINVRPFCTLPDQPVAPSALNKQSPEGTIGILYGREAMVVDLGGTIGKVAIATANLGATNPDEYGVLMDLEYANRVTSLEMIGKNWRFPTMDELTAMISKGLEWTDDRNGGAILPVGNTSLFFKSAGYYDDNGWHESDNRLLWWYNYCAFRVDKDFPSGAIEPSYNKTWGQTIRPFCDLPDF